jgi:Rrf2 family protein
VRVSAKLDYGLRALAELAVLPAGQTMTAERVATSQSIPHQFLENILGDLRVAGFVATRRGHDGGYRLARPAEQVVIGDVVRALDGPFGTVSGTAPAEVEFPGPAAALRDVWMAVELALGSVLDRVTLADVTARACRTP